MRPNSLLDGKRVLVTGGSRNLGRALCAVFAAEGARVALTYTRDAEGAEATAEAIRAEGGICRVFQANVLDQSATRGALKALDADWGGIDVLVNNAGITQNLPIPLLEEDDWDRVMDINVKGAWLTSRLALRGMMRRKAGVVLNIGSLVGSRMLDAPIHYVTSKAALDGMTRALAKQLSRHRIRVICLAPGLLEDGVGRNLPPHRLRDYLDHCALGRPGTFAEVARYAAFLVSDRNGFMNGTTVVMDGGL